MAKDKPAPYKMRYDESGSGRSLIRVYDHKTDSYRYPKTDLEGELGHRWIERNYQTPLPTELSKRQIDESVEIGIGTLGRSLKIIKSGEYIILQANIPDSDNFESTITLSPDFDSDVLKKLSNIFEKNDSKT